MSAKKRRRAKVLPGPQETQMDSPNLSAIDKASFMEGLQQDCANPLHSTAVEEDLNVLQEERTENGRKTQTTAIKRGASVKRKKMEEKQSDKTRLSQRQQTEDQRRGTGSGKEKTTQSEEELPSGSALRKRTWVSSSDEGGDDASWIPSPKKAKAPSFSTTRKSSSGGSRSKKSSSGGGKPPNTQKREPPVGGGASHFQVVLGALQEFCDQYSESVESAAVRESVGCFSNTVRQHLLEKISCFKELRTLKRENTKVGSLIRTKTQRLMAAKCELMRAEREVQLLQKDEAELQQRLADIKQGQAFLHNIRQLSTRYLKHRREHPTEKETFGASSLPALLLESKYVQLRAVKNKVKKNTQT